MEPTDDRPLPVHLGPHAALIGQLQRVGHDFWRRGWSLGASGSYSVVAQREPRQLLITAQCTDKGSLVPVDFALVDSSGKGVIPDQAQASADVLLHCVIAEQARAGAILHTSSVWATILATKFESLGGVLIDGYAMQSGLAGADSRLQAQWFPIVDCLADATAMADQVRDTLQSASPLPSGFLVKQQGLFTWGHDLQTAVRHVEIMEFLFEVLARQAVRA
ncbi:MAG: class II aldolase/adducin family protein [Pirellulaceae bacterium]|nr:class II aldolase/adducin family protein [Pirellulaceae bacterium]